MHRLEKNLDQNVLSEGLYLAAFIRTLLWQKRKKKRKINKSLCWFLHNKPGKTMAWTGRKGQNLGQIENWCQLSSSFRKAQDNGTELGQAWKTSRYWELGCPAWKGRRASHYLQSEVFFVNPVTTPPPTPPGPIFLVAKKTKPAPAALGGEQGKKRKQREGWERGGARETLLECAIR